MTPELLIIAAIALAVLTLGLFQIPSPLPLIGVSAFLDRTEYLANRDFLGLALQTGDSWAAGCMDLQALVHPAR